MKSRIHRSVGRGCGFNTGLGLGLRGFGNGEMSLAVGLTRLPLLFCSGAASG